MEKCINDFSPSFSQLDSSTWNIDLQELEYNPSRKDLTDAKIHHLLAEELKPYRRVSSQSFFNFFTFSTFLEEIIRISIHSIKKSFKLNAFISNRNFSAIY